MHNLCRQRFLEKRAAFSAESSAASRFLSRSLAHKSRKLSYKRLSFALSSRLGAYSISL
jgi:hypothetical protein